MTRRKDNVATIDCHAHVIRHDVPLILGHRQAPERGATLEEYLTLLDDNGIGRGVLTAPSFYGTDNSLLLDALGREPARLRGTAIVDPDIDPVALRDFARRGIVGIRLNWLRRPDLPDIGSSGYRRLFSRVRDLGWHVEIYLEGPRLAHVLPRIRQSGVKVVIDHFGSPDPDRATTCAGFQEVLRAVSAGDTWVKLSAPYRLGGADPRAYAEALLREGGAEHLLWGSDWPWTQHEEGVTYSRCIDWLGAWISDPAARQIILTDAPATLFNF
jgi:predicted TIM-barrel fold metal-dependent hydrolase